MNRFGKRSLIATAAAAVLVATVGATAWAVTGHHADRNNRAGAAAVGHVAAPSVTPATHHYAIAASGFAPDHLGNTANDYFNNWDFASLRDFNGERCFNADVHLPNAATIRSVTVYFTKGVTGNVSFELNRQNLPLAKSTILAFFDSVPTGTTTAYTIKTILVTKKRLVNTSVFAYGMGVCPLGDATFSGAVVNYTG